MERPGYNLLPVEMGGGSTWRGGVKKGGRDFIACGQKMSTKNGAKFDHSSYLSRSCFFQKHPV